MTTPDCTFCEAVTDEPADTWVLRNDLVAARISPPNKDLPGWYQLQVNRHAATAANLTDDEAAAIGVATRDLSAAILEASGAARIYAYSMCEFGPNYHLVLGAAPETAPDEKRGGPLLARILNRDPDLARPRRAAEVAQAVQAAL